jgi:hypothetical protein
VVVVHVPIHAPDERRVVAEAVVGNLRQGQRNADAVHHGAEARGRVGAGAEALERVGLENRERLEWIDAATHLERAEIEELVRDDRAADAAGELMLRVAGI